MNTNKLLLFFSLMFSLVLPAQEGFRDVDAETFKKLSENKSYVIIDLRTDEEIAKKGMIPGAIQIDYFGKDAEKQIAGLDKTKTYLVYCAGGGRSSECSELMKKLKFNSVVNLAKGFDDWKRKGFETEQKK